MVDPKIFALWARVSIDAVPPGMLVGIPTLGTPVLDGANPWNGLIPLVPLGVVVLPAVTGFLPNE